MRRVIEFPCAGETLVGTLDEASGATGLLIVSGGNEVRSGAHRGMAELAAALANHGVPVFRFDRRGVGDATGANGGWRSSAADIAAASATFAALTMVPRIVGFGNCDAATALALFHKGAGIDGVVLANPWVGGTEDALPAAAAIRARYAEKLKDPREWLRAARGGVNLGNLVKGLRKAGSKPTSGGLADEIARGIANTPTAILLAERDSTAIAFRDAWRRLPPSPAVIDVLDSASHSFAGPSDKAWLKDRLLAAIRSYSAA